MGQQDKVVFFWPPPQQTKHQQRPCGSHVQKTWQASKLGSACGEVRADDSGGIRKARPCACKASNVSVSEFRTEPWPGLFKGKEPACPPVRLSTAQLYHASPFTINERPPLARPSPFAQFL